MNNLSGHIDAIEVSGQLSLVSVKLNETISLKAIVVETPKTASYLAIGKPINLLFKETEVIVGLKDNPSISLQNRIAGKVVKIEKGELISKLQVETAVGTLVSIISTEAIDRLSLVNGLSVVLMVKLNEIMLSE